MAAVGTYSRRVLTAAGFEVITVGGSASVAGERFMTTSAQNFSLVIGGPFYALLSRLRLLGADQLPTLGAALTLALIA